MVEIGQLPIWFNKLKHSKVNPKAFPEKGLYMIATKFQDLTPKF